MLTLKTNRRTRSSYPSPAKRMGGFFNVSTMVETYALNVSTCACFKICHNRHKKLIFFRFKEKNKRFYFLFKVKWGNSDNIEY